MNAKFLLLTLAAGLPLCALASPPQAMVITVDCENPVWPSLKQVAQHAGYDAFNPAYQVRQRLMLEGRRACRRGAAHVQLTFQAPLREVAPALTQAGEPN